MYYYYGFSSNSYSHHYFVESKFNIVVLLSTPDTMHINFVKSKFNIVVLLSTPNGPLPRHKLITRKMQVASYITLIPSSE
jgi:hypothetical protein